MSGTIESALRSCIEESSSARRQGFVLVTMDGGVTARIDATTITSARGGTIARTGAYVGVVACSGSASEIAKCGEDDSRSPLAKLCKDDSESPIAKLFEDDSQSSIARLFQDESQSSIGGAL